MIKATPEEIEYHSIEQLSYDSENFHKGYRTAEDKLLKQIKKLQRILNSHRVVIGTMYAPKVKK